MIPDKHIWVIPMMIFWLPPRATIWYCHFDMLIMPRAAAWWSRRLQFCLPKGGRLVKLEIAFPWRQGWDLVDPMATDWC